MNETIGLPSIFPVFKALDFINNSARGYGNDIATAPKHIVASGGMNLSLIPKIDPVNVSLLLKDSFGQIIRGTADIPIPYILEAWTCSSAACRVQHSLNPIVFFSFDPESGIVDTLASHQTIVCKANYQNVTVFFSVYGSTSSLLTMSFSVNCLSCGASQVRINDFTTNENPTWYCKYCLSGQYIINPNRDVCQDCPAGKCKFA